MVFLDNIKLLEGVSTSKIVGNPELIEGIGLVLGQYGIAQNESQRVQVAETLSSEVEELLSLVRSDYPQALPQKSFEASEKKASQEMNANERSLKESMKKARGYEGVFSETTSLKEAFNMYNSSISDEEVAAYLYAYPDSALKKIFPNIKDKYSEEGLVKKGLLCYGFGRLNYKYQYLSGDIYLALDNINPVSGSSADRDYIIEKYGLAVLEKQIGALESVLPRQRSFLSDKDPILLDVSAELFRKSVLKGSQAMGIDLTGLTVVAAFARYVASQPNSVMPSQLKKNIIDYYIYSKAVRLDRVDSEGLTPDKKTEAKAGIGEEAKKKGRLLFYEFLSMIDKKSLKALEAKWNSQYNSLVEPEYSKIPVVWTFSKLFKSDKPLRLQQAQRDGVAFIKSKRSGILGYDVGVGKTLTSLACISAAFDEGKSRVALVVVPAATYKKWVFEIKGGKDKEGKLLKGSLPHVHLFDYGNLNRDTVINRVMDYSEKDREFIEGLQESISPLKTSLIDLADEIAIGGFDSPERQRVAREKVDESLKLVQRLSEDDELGQLLSSERALLLDDIQDRQNGIGFRLRRSEVVEFADKIEKKLRVYLDAAVITLGRTRPIPDKSIILVNYHGAKQLGLGVGSQKKLQDTMYSILTQGLQNYDKDSVGEALSEAMGAKVAKQIAEKEKRVDEMLGKTVLGAKLLVEDLGIDMLVMDEAHNAKKVFTSVKGEVKGRVSSAGNELRENSPYQISSGTQSALAVQMFVLSQYVQAQTTGSVVLLTATPFTNSPLEIFSMLALSNHERLVKVGQGSLLNFFDNYIEEQREIVITSNNRAQVQSVITGFYNLAQLKKIVFDIVDYKTGDEAKVMRPSKITFSDRVVLTENGESKLLSNENAIVAMNDMQERYMAQIISYIEDKSKSALQLCSDAMEAVSEGVSCSFVEDYLTNLKKSVGKESQGVKILRGLSMGRLNALSPYLFACNDLPCPTAKDFVESSPKIDYVCKAIQSVKQYHEGRNEPMSGQVIYSDLGVRYFFMIKEYLVNEVGFKPSEVEIVASTIYTSINGKPKSLSASKREKIKEGFLSGEIKVVIGSSTIKEGIDLQNRSTVLYVLSPDWNPTDYNQVEGRIWRQGNIHKYVRIVNVCAADSADIFMMQKRGEKSQRIKLLLDKSDQTSQLSLDDFDAEEVKLSLVRDPLLKAELQVIKKRKLLSVKITEAKLKLMQAKALMELGQEAQEFLAFHSSQFAPVINVLGQALHDFRKERDRKEDEKKAKAYQEKYGLEIEMGEKPPYKEKFDPNDEAYSFESYAEVGLDSMPLEQVRSQLSGMLRKLNTITSQADKYQEFLQFLAKSERLQREIQREVPSFISTEQSIKSYLGILDRSKRNQWLGLRDTYVSYRTDLDAVGATSKLEVVSLVEDLQKKYEKLTKESSLLSKSIPTLVQQNIEARQAAKASEKTVAQQIEVFASYHKYMDDKVAPKAQKQLEKPKPKQDSEKLYLSVAGGLRAMAKIKTGEKSKLYLSVANGLEIMAKIKSRPKKAA